MATTEILTYADDPAANVSTQSEYNSSSSRVVGVSDGIADAKEANKVWRQCAFMAAGLANWLVSQGISVPDDGDLSALVTELQDGYDAAWATALDGVADTDGTLAANSDAKIATQKAVKTYVDAHSQFNSSVRLSAGNGFGSGNTHIRRFTTTVSSAGTDITYADDATAGMSCTINTTGVYAISYTDRRSDSAATGYMGISLNSTQLSTSLASITNADILAISVSNSNDPATVAGSFHLTAGDTIRAHADGMNDTGVLSRFTITRVA